MRAPASPSCAPPSPRWRTRESWTPRLSAAQDSPRRHRGHGVGPVGLPDMNRRSRHHLISSPGSALSERVIGLAIEVHRHLGPGLLESAYEECLCCELAKAGLAHARQQPLAVVYKDVRLECGYRMDVVVERELVIEIKTVERLMPIHEAQI